jgi:hypothetical protein
MTGMPPEDQSPPPEFDEQSAPVDEGAPIHYGAVPRDTPVYSSDGVQVGRVREMLDNYRENIFDGVVFEDGKGRLRFADAPEVARTAERAVVLAIDAEEAGRLDPPAKGGGGLGRLWGRR